MLDRNRRAWVSKLAEGRAGSNHVPQLGPTHQPKPGDIVITRIACHPSVRYTIGRPGEHPQLSCDSREKALRVARGFARRQPIDIWECENGRFTSVAPRALGEH